MDYALLLFRQGHQRYGKEFLKEMKKYAADLGEIDLSARNE